MSKEITMEQVARQRYSKRSPYWIVIHNDVYDVTNFLNEHPGGVEALTDYAGKDATKAFEDVGHSEDAREMMRKYKIGHVPAAQRNTYFDPCCKVRVPDKSRSLTPKASVGHHHPKAEPRVVAIVVPRESSWSYWWLLAAAVILLGGAFAAKKKMSA